MSQMSSNFKYISMNQKCRHLVFLKILSAVTPECVVDRLRRFNVYIWLLKPIYSQHECQFMQNTFGNTGQRMDSIRISELTSCLRMQQQLLECSNIKNVKCWYCNSFKIPSRVLAKFQSTTNLTTNPMNNIILYV